MAKIVASPAFALKTNDSRSQFIPNRHSMIEKADGGGLKMGDLSGLGVFSGPNVDQYWTSYLITITKIQFYKNGQLYLTIEGIKAGFTYPQMLAAFTKGEILGGLLQKSNDKIFGSDKSDYLQGFGGNDKLYGGKGNDTLVGGEGKDTLTGGKGADKFIFDAALSEKNVDTITDFSVKDDTIRLSQNIFSNVGAIGRLSDVAFTQGAQAKNADTRIIYDPNSGYLFYDADGDGVTPQVAFAKLRAHLNLTEKSFFVI